MFASLKKVLKWGPAKTAEQNKNQTTSFLLAGFTSIIEDVILWRNMGLSLSFIFLMNVFFFICIHWEINFMEMIFCICATILSIDAFEAWLKYKHRMACLKRLTNLSSPELDTIILNATTWTRKKWMEFVYLRATNHTKAFLLINILFSIIFLVGKYMSGYVFLYLTCMTLCLSHQITLPVLKFMKKIQHHADSDGEFEGLIPEVSEVDIKILSIEPEPSLNDEKQSLDYWKPEDLPLEDASDSSENSNSLVTNISLEKLQTLDKTVVDTSDSSEDEYIPLVKQNEHNIHPELERIPSASSWSSTAYNAFFNVTGAVANMVNPTQKQSKRKRVSSVDSSDGFEIIDKSDLN